MHSHRLKALFSLLGLTTSTMAQTSSWGEPFSVDLGDSTQSLVPIATSELAPVSSGFTASAPTLVTSLATPTSPTAFSSTTLLETSTLSSVIVSFSTVTPTILSTTPSPRPSAASLSASSSRSTQLTSSQGSATVAATSASTGAAAVPTPYVRMGVVGVLAGVAGVFVV